GRGAADEIEPIAEPHGAAFVCGEHRFHVFEESDGDDAAHTAAVERQEALGPGAEQVPVARRGERDRRVHHSAATLTSPTWMAPRAMASISASAKPCSRSTSRVCAP